MSDHLSLAKIIIESLGEPEDGVIVDDSLILDTLPEELPKEHFLMSIEHINNFSAASAIATQVVAKEKELDDLSASFTIKDDDHFNIEHVFAQDDDDEEGGVTSQVMIISGIGASAIKESVNELLGSPEEMADDDQEND